MDMVPSSRTYRYLAQKTETPTEHTSDRDGATVALSVLENPPSGPAQLLKQVQCLSVVGDQNHLVTGGGLGDGQEAVQHQHLTWDQHGVQMRWESVTFILAM